MARIPKRGWNPKPEAQPSLYEYADALADGTVRGRGAQLNPGNRYEQTRLHIDGEHLDQVARDKQAAANESRQAEAQSPVKIPLTMVQTQVMVDRTRTILNHVESPDLGFQWTLNPYRGCEHGCIYCYARPDHERLGMSSGLDFETKIMAKTDAPKLLEKELAHPRWQPQTVIMAGVTDVYQPIEREYSITRGCLEVFAKCRHPVGIVTKNRLILRDLDVLKTLAAHRAVSVAVSVTTLDNKLAAHMEPRASSPSERLDTIAQLSRAGIPVTAMVAPIVPAVTDREVPAILKAVAEAGATRAGYVLLRLPFQLKDLFEDWLERHFPQRKEHVLSLLRQSRDGALYDPRWHKRQRGTGQYAEHLNRMFHTFAKRNGLNQTRHPLNKRAFIRPGKNKQGELFDMSS